MFRTDIITRGSVRLSTWLLNASVRTTATHAATTADQLPTSTADTEDKMKTAAKLLKSAAKLPSIVLDPPDIHLILPTADPTTAAAVSATPTEITPLYTDSWLTGLGFAASGQIHNGKDKPTNRYIGVRINFPLS